MPLFIPEYREPNNGGDLHRIDRSAAGEAVGLSHTASAYAIGAVVAIIFNTVLAWLKDSYESLNTAMAHTFGHHWSHPQRGRRGRFHPGRL